LDETPPCTPRCRPHKRHSHPPEPLHPRTKRLHIRLFRPPLRCRRRLFPRPNLQKQHLPAKRREPARQNRRHLQQQEGSCQACSVRPSIQPASKRKWTGTDAPPEDPSTRVIANDINASCYSDSFFNLVTLSKRQSAAQIPPICLSPSNPPRGSPCEKAQHCSADSYCNWGLCTPCTSTDSCLGAKCRSNNKCKTGFCNNHGRCDYAGQKKIFTGPGARGKSRNSRIPGVPKGHERGPARVRSEAMRVSIPGEKVRATGTA
jgi:hypothetical protein